MIYFLLNVTKKLFKPLKHGLPSLYCALCGRKQNWIYTRYICSYLIGISLAFIFWEIFIRNLEYSLDLTYGSLTVLILILGVGFVLTTAVKCIAFLACVGLVGKTGRGFLRALCVAYILSGPVSNLALNGQEIVRVFACTTILTYNLTKTRFDLMTKPFQNTLAVMKDEISEIRKNFDNIEDVLLPIKDEIEGDFSAGNSSQAIPVFGKVAPRDVLSALSFADSTNANEKIAKARNYNENYANKMRLRCKEQLKLGENRCKDAFSSAHDKCMESLPAIVDVLLCWPLRIDYVCNMKLIGYQENGGICEPTDVINPKLGENMVKLKETEREIFQNATDVKIMYQVAKVQQPPQFKAAKETAKVVMDEFNKKRIMFDYVLGIMQKILSFVFIRIIHSSVVYHKNYLGRIDFDNLYITPYFKKIDARRKETNQHSLLPLKKFQQQSLVDTENTANRTKQESTATTFFLLQFLLELLISGFFLLLDHMVVILLRIVASKSEITYYQEGEHIITFHINGTGLMARLMKSTLKNFNMHERISTFLTNKPCLPEPTFLPRRYYITLAGMYIATLGLIYYSSITLRSRRYICSYFYPKREKKRILHLYNQMLKERKIVFETMYRNVKDNMESHRLKNKLNLLLWLRVKLPTICGWLRWFHIARRKCLICRETMPRNVNSGCSMKFVECKSANCDLVYCEECWVDVGEVCMACQNVDNLLKYCEH